MSGNGQGNVREFWTNSNVATLVCVAWTPSRLQFQTWPGRSLEHINQNGVKWHNLVMRLKLVEFLFQRMMWQVWAVCTATQRTPPPLIWRNPRLRSSQTEDCPGATTTAEWPSTRPRPSVKRRLNWTTIHLSVVMANITATKTYLHQVRLCLLWTGECPLDKHGNNRQQTNTF